MYVCKYTSFLENGNNGNIYSKNIDRLNHLYTFEQTELRIFKKYIYIQYIKMAMHKKG